MASPKSNAALTQLGKDLRAARLRRGMARSDLAVRAGTSLSTVVRLESGEPGVGIGAVADILVALGLIERLGDLLDVSHDQLGLALANENLPKRGRSYSSALRRQQMKKTTDAAEAMEAVNPDGVAF